MAPSWSITRQGVGHENHFATRFFILIKSKSKRLSDKPCSNIYCGLVISAGNTQNIVLPVGRRAGKINSMYGRPFAGLVQSPHLSVVISNQLSGSDLMSAVFDAWPILIFILMSLLVSGVLVWGLVCL